MQLSREKSEQNRDSNEWRLEPRVYIKYVYMGTQNSALTLIASHKSYSMLTDCMSAFVQIPMHH